MTAVAPVSQLLKKEQTPRRVSLEAYFRAEEKAVYKSEFHDGKIFKMAGGTFNHDKLANMAITLMNVFVETSDINYHVNGSDLKIRIDAINRIVYSDALVICERPEFFEGRKDTITNPLIIVEVTSPSTKNYDRHDKFAAYRTIPSFREYVIISQERKLVTVFTRQTDNSWLLRDYEGDESTAILRALHDCPLELRRLYRGIEMSD